jgi:branched-chain amino acid transport system substrate-binding protein
VGLARLLPAILAAVLLLSVGGAQAPGAEDVIVLGAAVSLTGKFAPNGTNTKNGYELAVREVNDNGGVKVGGRSYKLTVRYYDDESTPVRDTALAERLITQDDVKFMLGPYGSDLTKAILPVVEKYQVPMLEGNGAARELFTQGYRYISACSPPQTNISRPPSTLLPSMPTSLARARTSCGWRWPWRTTRSRRMSAPACSTTCGATA